MLAKKIWAPTQQTQRQKTGSANQQLVCRGTIMFCTSVFQCSEREVGKSGARIGKFLAILIYKTTLQNGFDDVNTNKYICIIN